MRLCQLIANDTGEGSFLCEDCEGYEVTVMRSGAGWYLGTYCESGPKCRITGYMSSEDAEKLLRDFKLKYKEDKL